MAGKPQRDGTIFMGGADPLRQQIGNRRRARLDGMVKK